MLLLPDLPLVEKDKDHGSSDCCENKLFSFVGFLLLLKLKKGHFDCCFAVYFGQKMFV